MPGEQLRPPTDQDFLRGGVYPLAAAGLSRGVPGCRHLTPPWVRFPSALINWLFNAHGNGVRVPIPGSAGSWFLARVEIWSD